jgi:hypothetical protein
MTTNQIRKVCLITFLTSFTFYAGISCSADLPEGKIVCTPENFQKECPDRWECRDGKCYKPIVDKTATSGDATIIANPDATGKAVTDDPVSSGCVTIDCASRCGPFEGCFGTINCGECENGFLCSSETGECIPTCGGCVIDGVCYETGMKNPKNGCEVCLPATSTSAWSADDGAVCDDGKFCTVSDKCVKKVCQGEKRSCDDGRKITADTCSDADVQCNNKCTCKAPQVCDFEGDSCKDNCSDDQCNINAVCYDDGRRRSANPCEVCDINANPTKWSVDVGYKCGSNSSNACLGQDRCDESGECVTQPATTGTRCGDTSQTECSAPDTCDGDGNCRPNHYGLDRGCGGTPETCENQRRCDSNGNCGQQTYRSGVKCDDASDSECSSGSYCNWIGACVVDAYTGQACGDNSSENICVTYQCNSNGTCGKTNTTVQCGNRESDNECTQDTYCSGGKCPSIYKADNTQCGGTPAPCTAQRVCKNHACAEAASLADDTACTPTGGAKAPACQAYKCLSGSCALQNLANDTSCTPASGSTSVCQTYKCQSGACEPQNLADNSSCTPTGGAKAPACQAYTCQSGACSLSNIAAGQSCRCQNQGRQQPTGKCDGNGSCVCSQPPQGGTGGSPPQGGGAGTG